MKITYDDSNEAAVLFVLRAIQEHGQDDAERIAAVQGLLDAAGFQATATCWPVFGGIWPKPCEGPDAEQATAWLKKTTDDLRRGEFQSEITQIATALTSKRREHARDRHHQD